MNHSQEKTFIWRCLNALVHELPVSDGDFSFDDRMDWNYIIQTANSQRVLAFIGALLEEDSSLGRLDPSIQFQLRSAIELAVWENRIKMLEFTRVQTLFKKQNIPIIPLKGVALTPLIYAKYPFRRMTDIDLLIRPGDLKKSRVFLAEQGLQLKEMCNRWQTEPLARAWGRYSFTDGSLDLDLQWTPRFLIGGRWVEWDLEQAWQRSQPFSQMGENVFVLSALDQSIYLSLQILNDIDSNIPRLAQILDLALVTKRYSLFYKDILEETKLFLAASDHQRLAQLLEAVDENFLRKIKGHSFSNQLNIILESFFCPILSERVPPIPFSIIPASFRERFLFRVGYLFPGEDFLRQRTHQGIFGAIVCYLNHWARLFLKVFVKDTGAKNKSR